MNAEDVREDSRSYQGASYIAPRHPGRPVKSSLLMSIDTKVLNKLLAENPTTH